MFFADRYMVLQTHLQIEQRNCWLPNAAMSPVADLPWNDGNGNVMLDKWNLMLTERRKTYILIEIKLKKHDVNIHAEAQWANN